MSRARRPDPRRASIHRSYTVAEAARLFGAHRNTVNAWLKAGLRSFLIGRTRMILGEDMRAFLQARQRKRRNPLRPGEMRCMGCRQSRSPDPVLIEWASRNEDGSGGNLRGLCPGCGSLMHRKIGRTGPEKAGFSFAATLPDSDLPNAAGSCVNSAMGETAGPAAMNSPSASPWRVPPCADLRPDSASFGRLNSSREPRFDTTPPPLKLPAQPWSADQ